MFPRVDRATATSLSHPSARAALSVSFAQPICCEANFSSRECVHVCHCRSIGFDDAGDCGRK